MIKAVVYTSNTGTTKKYAQLICKNTGLACYSLDKAKTELVKDSEIIYLGWIMAGGIKEFKTAIKLFKVVAVCGIGMGKTGTQLDDVKSKNNIGSDIAVFTLQGGFDISKLKGIYRFMMNTMAKTAGKKLAEKADRTEDENDMLDMMQNGGNRVSEENLKSFFEWYNSAAK